VTNASVSASAAIALSKLATTGTMTFASTIGVGGATPAASGAGITFPASASASTDANTLDDYEEGTWTPVITSSSAPTVVYATQEGFYTKTGRNVVLSARISTTSVSGGSGSVSLSGVPFTPASSANPYENGGKTYVEVSTFTGESPIDVRVVSTSAFLYYRTSATDGETNLQVSDLKTTAGNTFSFSINLRV
jgi:hypothetical protein